MSKAMSAVAPEKTVSVAPSPADTAIWVGPEDTTEDAESAPPAGRFERCGAAGALLRLLRLAALTDVPGRSHGHRLAHGLLLIGLDTAAMVILVRRNVQMFIQSLADGKPITEIAMYTGYLGVIFVTMWASVALAVVAGRRRHGQVMVTSERVLARAAALSSFRTSNKTLFRRNSFLLAAVVIVNAYTVCCTFFLFFNVDNISHASTRDVIHFLSLTFIDCANLLVPIKFALPAIELLAGYRAVADELNDICQAKRLPSISELRRLRAIYVELSETFSSLTDGMSAELIFSMFYGILASISVSLVAITGLLLSNNAWIIFVVMYSLGASLAVLLPCELAQRALNAAHRTHGLLLRPPLQLPALQHELGLFRESVGRDLASLGDLGLFRLQRSSVLSIVATIATYIIVMVQFLVTELAATA
ncbi:hypothetical protein FJT64_004708 [Amphibalanus amphitrite]|uniref:Gustatory receptor n=1 Tax=Amphibalanus amphitrite TaxID=1232801 RepID=A0A6A4W4J8_AMPAM|nr:hypothetical protein FJT64_004708 [Amphibalanus amphitrite]